MEVGSSLGGNNVEALGKMQKRFTRMLQGLELLAIRRGWETWIVFFGRRRLKGDSVEVVRIMTGIDSVSEFNMKFTI